MGDGWHVARIAPTHVALLAVAKNSRETLRHLRLLSDVEDAHGHCVRQGARRSAARSLRLSCDFEKSDFYQLFFCEKNA